MHVRCKKTFCEDPEIGPPLPHCAPSLPLTHTFPLSLSQCLWTSGGTVYKKFMGSVGRIASLMLNAGSFFFFFPDVMTPPVSHVFEQNELLQWKQRWCKREREVLLVNHYYTLLIYECKCRCQCYSVETLLPDCGTAWSRMLIYFLILPGLKTIIAGSAHRPARKPQEAMSHSFLPVPPWVKRRKQE